MGAVIFLLLLMLYNLHCAGDGLLVVERGHLSLAGNSAVIVGGYQYLEPPSQC